MRLYHCSGNHYSHSLAAGVLINQALNHVAISSIYFREEGDATFIVEDATDPGWGPPPQEGASLFQATFNMVSIYLLAGDQLDI